MPERIQLHRVKGWRKPPGAVVVARPTKWGNPYRLGDPDPRHGWAMSRMEVVEAFKRELLATIEKPWTTAHTIEFRVIAESLDELRGHDLACWCVKGDHCHADVLLELANGRVNA